MNSNPAAPNGGPGLRDRPCHILTIWRDRPGQTQSYVDPPLSVDEATDKLANYLKIESKFVWVHIYGNNPFLFQFLLGLSGTQNHVKLQQTFRKLYNPAAQRAPDLENRNRGKAVTKSEYFQEGGEPGCAVFMPVAQYECLDQNQNQGVATAEQVMDIASRLRDGKFRDLPIADQLWAAHGQNLVLTSTPCPRRDDVFRRLLFDIDTGSISSSDLPLDSTGLFSLVLCRCICNHSDFLEASRTIVDEASTAGVTGFNDLRYLLEKLPQPEKEAYDSDLRKVIDNLIRIQSEIRWRNVLSVIVQNVSILLDVCEEQRNAREALVEAVMDYPQVSEIRLWDQQGFISQLESWNKALRRQLEELRRMHQDQIHNAQAQMNDLFAFKQSLSSVLSSQFQLRQADASTRSGNIIMYFTMMTILFSSLSFMAAFFALNVRSFPRNDQGDVELSMSYVASRIGQYAPAAEMRTLANQANSTTVAWSIAIAAPFWLLAAFLNPMADFLNWLLPGWLSPEKASSNTEDPQTQRRNENEV